MGETGRALLLAVDGILNQGIFDFTKGFELLALKLYWESDNHVRLTRKLRRVNQSQLRVVLHRLSMASTGTEYGY